MRAWGEPFLALGALTTIVTCANLVQGTTSKPTSKAATSPAPVSVASSDSGTNGGVESARVVPAGSDLVANSSAREHGGLSRWTEAVRDFRAGLRLTPLRILWFGDSHSAADYWPSAVRRILSEQLPVGGPGYLSLGVPNYRHSMARLWQDGSLEVAPHPPARRSTEDDGVFGLGGTRVTMKDATAILTLKLAFDGSAETQVTYDVYYRTRTPADRLLLSFGTERRELGLSDATTTIGGLSVSRFSFKGASSVEIRALRGTPQVFGIVAETERPGIVVDTLGINGARFGTFLAWEPRSFQALVAQRQPLVAVIAYGTNEVYDEEAVSRHAARLEQVIDRLRGAIPDVGCIVVGPTDVGRGGEAAASRVVAIDQAERATAERLGCVYFSPYEVMTQEGGFLAWRDRDPPLALSDGIHLTAKGYARLGEEMARRYLVVR